jgi:HAD superfamily hydrolase (TIGR01458 family)
MEIRGFLIDLDGVMYTGEKMTPGADTAIRLLTENGFVYRFVSNTTRKSRHTLAVQLSRMGLEIPESYIFTPSVAAVAYMKDNDKYRYRLLATGDVNRDFPPVSSEDPLERLDYVILGDAGNEITYASLNTAFRDLIEGAELIALEKDRYWMAPGGLALSAGPFVAALEFAAGKKAVIMGKPSRAFFSLALEDMDVSPEQAVMIGDDIITDVGGAHDAGLRGVLVKTGKFREDVMKRTSVRPDLIIESIADIREIIDAAYNDRWMNH